MRECSSSSSSSSSSPSWPSNQQNNSSYSSSFSSSPSINSSNLIYFPLNNCQSTSLIKDSNNFYLNIKTNSKQQKLNKNGKENQKNNIISKRKRKNPNLIIGIKFGGKKPHQVARRNERERKRVQQVNDGYEKLANTLNNFEPICNERKLTKAETLKTAILYIKHLEDLLKQQPLEKQNKIKNENNSEHSTNFCQNLNFSQENQKQFLTKNSNTPNFICSPPPPTINTNYNNLNNNNIYLNNNSFQNCSFPYIKQK
uniref:BHLH domain-containing protein n=1 Tax=Meloidogyne incognita TaxID=6306 RepID=A0A914KIQ1_MELIC